MVVVLVELLPVLVVVVLFSVVLVECVNPIAKPWANGKPTPFIAPQASEIVTRRTPLWSRVNSLRYTPLVSGELAQVPEQREFTYSGSLVAAGHL